MRLLSGALTLVAAALLGAVLILGHGGAGAVATAELGTSLVSVRVDCVYTNASGTYVVFGYHNAGAPVERSVGVDGTAVNLVSPERHQGAQVTTLDSGDHSGAFEVGPLSPGESASWRLDGAEVSSDARTPTCVPGPQLPGPGNGLGQLLVMFGSLPFVVAAVLLTARRQQVRHNRSI